MGARGVAMQDLRAREPLLDREVVAVQGDAPMTVGRPRDHGLGEVAGELLRRVDAAPGGSQDGPEPNGMKFRGKLSVYKGVIGVGLP